MRTPAHHLRLVGTQAEPEPASAAAPADLALLSVLLAVNLVPIAGELARPGAWGPGTVGLAAAGALLAGRALAAEVRALVRGRA